MTIRAPSSLALAVAAGTALLALASCSEDDVPTSDAQAAVAALTADADSAPGQVALAGTAPDGVMADALSAVMGASEIPYPVYPNGMKYRVGGENGLKIVVFQTEDSFDEVDEYYKSVSVDRMMPRLMAMTDYVRYPSDSADDDPWATYRPGIVIHEFDGDDARRAAGATPSARTNIIMSY